MHTMNHLLFSATRRVLTSVPSGKIEKTVTHGCLVFGCLGEELWLRKVQVNL